jgi:hypothetical protein
MRHLSIAALLGISVLCAACAAPSTRLDGSSALAESSAPTESSGLRAQPISDRTIEARILAIDPKHVSDADVRDLLRHGPTPRIMLMHGGIYPVHLAMQSFASFLVGMGYPEEKIRDPRSGEWSHSPYEDAARLAGIAAWYYERDGVPPVLIGHSQGGMQAIKMLYVLTGEFGPSVAVWNPETDFAEPRTTIVDPLTRRQVPVVGGFKIGYVSAVAAGGAALLLPNQWEMIGKLQTIPDTVEEFTGYSIAVDFVAWDLPTTVAEPKFKTQGGTAVRNIVLDAENSHTLIPVAAGLLADPAARAWIDAYAPGTRVPPPAGSSANITWAADVWYSVKKIWVVEAQRLIRANRTAPRREMANNAQ